MRRTLGCVLAAGASGCLMPNPVYLGEGQGSSGAAVSTSGPDEAASTTSGPVAGGSGDADAEGGSGPQTASTTSPGTDASAGTSSTGELDVSEVCPPEASLASCIPFDVDAPEEVTDGSSYANTVEIEGGVLVPSLSQRALLLDPTTRVELDCLEACVGGATMTYEAWVRIDVPPAVRAGVIDNNGLIGVFVTADLALRCNTPAGTAAGGDIPLGTWVHVACVAEEELLVGYVDGEQVAQRTIEPLEPVEEPRIALGNDMPSFGDPLIGALDVVRVWMVARTHEQIAAAATP